MFEYALRERLQVSIMTQTVADIRKRLSHADWDEFQVLQRSLASDARKGVQDALNHARKRLENERLEAERLKGLYQFERELAQGKLVVGLDEVGRGPLAGPLTVAAVVLYPDADLIQGLNDSKQVPEHKRKDIVQAIKRAALAYSVVHISPQDIDALGMSACLRQGFTTALAQVESQGVMPEVVLIDGNPLHIDPREINVIKGDARCASIAAASLLAKTTRDALMVAYEDEYPGYDFKHSKGYGSLKHREAIAQLGLSPIHRKSFCQNFYQTSLF